MFESGAILEYLIERYGAGRLGPAPGGPERVLYLQWIHFVEATFQRQLDDIFSHEQALSSAERSARVAADARERAGSALGLVERSLTGRDHLLAAGFSGADIMMGYSLLSAKYFGVLQDPHRNASAYLGRLLERPAFRKALAP